MSLSFSEKRGLQKTVVEKLADLKDGGLSFKEKRKTQRALSEALSKLSAGLLSSYTQEDLSAKAEEYAKAKADEKAAEVTPEAEQEQPAAVAPWGGRSFTLYVDEEYGPPPPHTEAYEAAKSAPSGSVIHGLTVRPSGKQWHNLYLSHGNGDFSSVSVGKDMPSNTAELIEQGFSDYDKKQKKQANALEEKNAISAKEIAIAKENNLVLGRELGTIIPNTGKQFKSAKIVADHGDGSFTLRGVQGNKQAELRGLPASSIVRAVDRYNLNAGTESEAWRKNYLSAAKVARDLGIDPKQREQAEREVDDFMLVGSNSQIDQAEARGQNNLFDQAAQATDTDPSEAQKLTGNYKKGAASFQGLDIAIENPANSSRKGVNEAGEDWENHMPVHYGYFKGTKGADGDPIDVFVGSNEASEKAFIIDQLNGSGEFDEHKVMLGFETAQSAKTAYLASYDEDWKGGIGAITEVAIDDLKAWLKSGDKSSRFQPSPPVSRESSFPGIPGKESEVRTAKGTKVNTQFTILEADKLIASHTADGRLNPDFPQELQPRDRSRDASKAWIQKTAKDLDPGLLGRTKKADSGAPIIGPDRIVESGNGRTLAIIEAYRIGAAKEYRDWLIEEAEIYGFTPDQVKAMSQPVLVRVRTSAIDRQVFAVEANQDDKLAMTATEKAKADAGRLTPELMGRFSPGEDGDLLVAASRDFIRGFLQSLGDAEAAQYATKSGEPTGTLIARIQAAVFAKAYEDERLLELMADTAKPENANMIKALSAAAPEFIMAREANENGTQEVSSQLADSIGLSLDNEAVRSLIDAANIVRKARRENMDVGEYVSQMGLFGDIDPGVAAMAVFIAQNNRSAKRLGVAFKAMARFVRQELEHGNNFDMFGERQVDMSQVVEAANKAMENEYGEGSYAIGIQNSSGGLFESLERRRRKAFQAIYG